MTFSSGTPWQSGGNLDEIEIEENAEEGEAIHPARKRERPKSRAVLISKSRIPFIQGHLSIRRDNHMLLCRHRRSGTTTHLALVGSVPAAQCYRQRSAAPDVHQTPTGDGHVSAPLCGLYPAVRGYVARSARSTNGRRVDRHSTPEYSAQDY